MKTNKLDWLVPFKVGFHVSKRRNARVRTPRPNQEHRLYHSVSHSQEPPLTDAAVIDVSSSQRPPHTDTAVIDLREEGEPQARDVENSVAAEEINDSFEQDGFIASLTLFYMAVGASFAVCFAKWLPMVEKVGVKEEHLHTLVIFLMLAACVCVWFLLFKRRKPFIWDYILVQNRDVSILATVFARPISESIQVMIQSSIPLMGIVVFFTLGLFLDIVVIIGHVDCVSAFYFCDLLFPFYASFIFHVTRVVFQASLIAFAFAFYKKSFRRTCSARYILLTILAAIVVVWVESLLQYSRDVLWAPNSYKCADKDYQEGNIDANKTLQCMAWKTPIYDIYGQVSSHLYPFHFEYALIVLEIVSQMYMSADNPPELICSGTGMEAEDGGVAGGRVVEDLDEDNGQSDGCRLRAEDEGAPLLGSTSGLDLSARVRRAMSCNLSMSFTVCLVINVVLVVIAALTRLDNFTDDPPEVDQLNTDAPTEESYKWHMIYETYKTVNFFLLSVCSLVGFKYSCSAVSEFSCYSGLELLAIASCTSFFIHETFDMIASFSYLIGTVSEEEPQIENQALLFVNMVRSGNPDNPQRPIFPNTFVGMAIARGLINLCQFFLQITFMLHISRIKPRGETARKVLKEISLVMVVSNFGLWVVDSFVEVEQMFPIPDYYYAPRIWRLLSNILVPFFMFFRFNAVLMFLGVYLKL